MSCVFFNKKIKLQSLSFTYFLHKKNNDLFLIFSGLKNKYYFKVKKNEAVEVFKIK
jgi:hypothetical protein